MAVPSWSGSSGSLQDLLTQKQANPANQGGGQSPYVNFHTSATPVMGVAELSALGQDAAQQYLGRNMSATELANFVNFFQGQQQRSASEKYQAESQLTTWGSLAENVAASVRRGTRVVVTGRLEQQTGKAKDGSERSKVAIVASRRQRVPGGAQDDFRGDLLVLKNP